MRSLRLLPLLLLTPLLVLLTAGCGGGSRNGDDNPAHELAVLPFTVNGGRAQILVGMPIAIGAETDPAGDVPFLPVSDAIRAQDVGKAFVVPAEGATYAQMIAALTDGEDSVFALKTLAGSSGMLESFVLDVFAPQGGVPDLAGYTLESVVMHVEQASFAIPGSDPNGDGIWTDYEIAVRFHFFGRRQ